MDRNTDSSLSHELPTHLGVSQPLLRLGPIRLDVTTLSKLAVGCLAAAWAWQLHGPPPALRLAGVLLVSLIDSRLRGRATGGAAAGSLAPAAGRVRAAAAAVRLEVPRPGPPLGSRPAQRDPSMHTVGTD